VIAAAHGLSITSVTPATLPVDGNNHTIIIRGTGLTAGGGPGIGPSATNTNPETGPCTDLNGFVESTSKNLVNPTEIDATFNLPPGCPPGRIRSS